MREIDIKLSDPSTINSFLNTISRVDGDVIVKSGRYELDARSLLGLFLCDLSRPVKLLIYSNEENILPAVERYIATE